MGRDPSPLRWPPPGLERLQGDLWQVAGRGALSGGILVLPLLFVVARHQDFASQGPFADAWWVTVVLATVGLGFALDALASAARMLRRAAEAVQSGYDTATVLRVLADRGKDMGFLLQGGRHFSMMEPAARERAARGRVVAAAGNALAGLWLPASLGISLLLAGRGLLGDTALWVATLAPAAVLYGVAGVVRVLEEDQLRRARSRWFQQPWALDLDAEEVRAWRSEMAGRGGSDASRSSASRAGAFRRLALVLSLLAVLVAVPVLTLVPASVIGPVLALVALPRLGQVQERAARAEALRPFRVGSDPSISPEEAGALLHELLFVGSRGGPAPGVREPATRYADPWLPERAEGNPVGAEPHRWPDVLFPLLASGPSPELEAFLGQVATHPAHTAFTRLARARELDVAAARWTDPFPPGTTVASIPIPSLGALRNGAYAHLAAAAADLARGREAEAEVRIREVISVGLLLGDHGVTLIDNLVGYVVAGSGGTALERFYDATGRTDEAERLRELQRAAERAARRLRPVQPEGTEAFVRSLPGMVDDTAAVRGLRWEYFTLTATLSPCLNLHRMVFGPGDDYAAFVERARGTLVRWPSEEPLFELARVGYLGAAAGEGPSLFGRLLGVAMRPGQGSCSEVVGRFEALREAM